jgi:hypothetical protein
MLNGKFQGREGGGGGGGGGDGAAACRDIGREAEGEEQQKTGMKGGPDRADEIGLD